VIPSQADGHVGAVVVRSGNSSGPDPVRRNASFDGTVAFAKLDCNRSGAVRHHSGGASGTPELRCTSSRARTGSPRIEDRDGQGVRGLEEAAAPDIVVISHTDGGRLVSNDRLSLAPSRAHAELMIPLGFRRSGSMRQDEASGAAGTDG
jgi:hypothetical protein